MLCHEVSTCKGGSHRLVEHRIRAVCEPSMGAVHLPSTHLELFETGSVTRVTLNPKPIRVTGSSFLSPKLPPEKHCTKPNVIRVKMHVFVATITRVPVLFEPKQV